MSDQHRIVKSLPKIESSSYHKFMSDIDLTPILDDLAAGRIDAAEAGRRIDALKAGAAPAPGPEPEPARPDLDESNRSGAGNQGVTKLSIFAIGRRVRLEGDSSIATVSVEGPHVLRRQGGTIEISSNGEVGPSFDGFSLIRPPRSLDDLRSIGLGKELLIKVNPKIEVDVEVTTGGLNSKSVPTFGKVRVTAAGAELSDVVEVKDLLAQAGAATVAGPVSRGRSRVRVESGTLTVRLTGGANVVVRAESHLGRINWPGERSGSIDELVVGNGSARLDLGVVMGMATIKDET